LNSGVNLRRFCIWTPLSQLRFVDYTGCPTFGAHYTIHQRIDEQVAAKIQHLQNTRLSGTQVLEVLKRYWGARH
jgi:hypothetical protein